MTTDKLFQPGDQPGRIPRHRMVMASRTTADRDTCRGGRAAGDVDDPPHLHAMQEA